MIERTANAMNYDHPLRYIDDRVDRLLDAAIEVAEAQRQYERDNTHITHLMAAIRNLRRVLGWA